MFGVHTVIVHNRNKIIFSQIITSGQQHVFCCEQRQAISSSYVSCETILDLCRISRKGDWKTRSGLVPRGNDWLRGSAFKKYHNDNYSLL